MRNPFTAAIFPAGKRRNRHSELHATLEVHSTRQGEGEGTVKIIAGSGGVHHLDFRGSNMIEFLIMDIIGALVSVGNDQPAVNLCLQSKYFVRKRPLPKTESSTVKEI